MKSKLFLFSSLLLFAPGAPVRSQNPAPDNTIRVTTTIHTDGTKTVMQSDPEKRIAESSNYDHANKLTQKTVFDLDDQGQAVGGSVYSAKGVLTGKMQYKRDAMNRVSEVLTFTPDDKLLLRAVYSYDAGNRVVKIDTFDAAGNVVKSDVAGKPTPTQGKKGSHYRTH